MSIGFHFDDIDMELMEKESPMYDPSPIISDTQIYNGLMTINPKSESIYLCNQKDIETKDFTGLPNGSLVMVYQ